MKKINQKGQTLIEALVALAIIVIVISAITILILTSLYNSQFIADQNIANKYSQQGMEFVRSYQASNIAKFRLLNGANYYLNASREFVGVGDPGYDITDAEFGNMRRTFDFLQGDPLCNPTPAPPNPPSQIHLTRVIVTTSWSSSKCGDATNFCHNSKVESCLPYDNGIAP